MKMEVGPRLKIEGMEDTGESVLRKPSAPMRKN